MTIVITARLIVMKILNLATKTSNLTTKKSFLLMNNYHYVVRNNDCKKFMYYRDTIDIVMLNLRYIDDDSCTIAQL